MLPGPSVNSPFLSCPLSVLSRQISSSRPVPIRVLQTQPKPMARDPSKVPKLADVARAAKVGNATVSRALSGGKNVSSDAMKRILDVVLDLGYQPNRVAQSLKGASSGIVGMIVPSLSDMFFSKCAEAVESVTRERDALLVLVASHDEDTNVLSSFQRLLLHPYRRPDSRPLRAEKRCAD